MGNYPPLVQTAVTEPKGTETAPPVECLRCCLPAVEEHTSRTAIAFSTGSETGMFAGGRFWAGRLANSRGGSWMASGAEQTASAPCQLPGMQSNANPPDVRRNKKKGVGGTHQFHGSKKVRRQRPVLFGPAAVWTRRTLRRGWAECFVPFLWDRSVMTWGWGGGGLYRFDCCGCCGVALQTSLS